MYWTLGDLLPECMDAVLVATRKCRLQLIQVEAGSPVQSTYCMYVYSMNIHEPGASWPLFLYCM